MKKIYEFQNDCRPGVYTRTFILGMILWILGSWMVFDFGADCKMWISECPEWYKDKDFYIDMIALPVGFTLIWYGTGWVTKTVL